MNIINGEPIMYMNDTECLSQRWLYTLSAHPELWLLEFKKTLWQCGRGRVSPADGERQAKPTGKCD